jgi:AcrR family transcriptional regulator
MLYEPTRFESLTMRGLGQELGVQAMSLYNHVANKDEIRDGIVELVMNEIEPPSGPTGRPRSGRARCLRTTRSCATHGPAASRWSRRRSVQRECVGWRTCCEHFAKPASPPT